MGVAVPHFAGRANGHPCRIKPVPQHATWPPIYWWSWQHAQSKLVRCMGWRHEHVRSPNVHGELHETPSGPKLRITGTCLKWCYLKKLHKEIKRVLPSSQLQLLDNLFDSNTVNAYAFSKLVSGLIGIDMFVGAILKALEHRFSENTDGWFVIFLSDMYVNRHNCAQILLEEPWCFRRFKTCSHVQTWKGILHETVHKIQ